MPPLEHIGMTSRAVLWTIVRHDGDGFPLVSAPIDKKVQWEEMNKEMLDKDGNRIQVDVVVASPAQIAMGSLMWEGEIADLPLVEGIRTPPSDLYEVVGRDRGKELRGMITRYEFGLRRYKDSLPRMVS